MSEQDYHADHVTWCTNHDSEFTMHSEDEPYCSNTLGGPRLIPEGNAVKATVWVAATRAFTHGKFTTAEYVAREDHYDGVAITIDTWCGPGQDAGEQTFRLTSDAARSLAAVLVRVADIEQGLTP
jgi:hypothetical protein